MLRNNGGDDLAVSGERRLHLRDTAHQRQHLRGHRSRRQPSGQTCTVSNGSRHRRRRQRHQRRGELRHQPRSPSAVRSPASPARGSSCATTAVTTSPSPRTAPSPSPHRSPAGSTYAVTVWHPAVRHRPARCRTARAPSASANVTNVCRHLRHQPTARFTIGGTVTGLTGTGLVLRNNGGDDLAVSANGAFTFATVAHQRQHLLGHGLRPSRPDRPAPSRMARAPSARANVTNVSVTCSPTRHRDSPSAGPSPASSGTGLVLRNNGGDNLAVSANGAFTFATAAHQRQHLRGHRLHASRPGRPARSRTARAPSPAPTSPTVVVTCVTNPPPVHHRRHGHRPFGRRARAPEQRRRRPRRRRRTAPSPSPPRSPAAAPTRSRSSTQPSGQTCTVSNGSGTVGGRNVTNVVVTCATNPPPSSPSAARSAGLPAAGLVLRNNGGDDLAIAANGTFTFATSLTSAAAPTRSRSSTQPTGQTCTVSNGSGTVAGANVTNVSVTCVTNPPPRFTIGGTVTGLSGPGSSSATTAATTSPSSANGAFTFATSLTSGSTYAVTVCTQPSGQTCSVSHGSGTVAGANVTNVSGQLQLPLRRTSRRWCSMSSSGTNILGRGLMANDFRFTLPNPVRSGNVLILGISYGAPAGQVVTVRDNQGNSWPASPAVTRNESGRNHRLRHLRPAERAPGYHHSHHLVQPRRSITPSSSTPSPSSTAWPRPRR